MLNTQVGKEIFEAVSAALVYEPLNIDDVMQPPLRCSSRANAESENFFEIYQKHGYKKAIKAYYGWTYVLKYYIKKWIIRSKFQFITRRRV